MKRILLILTVLTISHIGIGQTLLYRTAVIHTNPTTLRGGTCRSWTANSVISYYQEQDTHYFAVVYENSTTMDAIKFVNGNYSIYDFCVLGDSIYLCGTKEGRSVVGCININDITSSVPSSQIEEKYFDSLVSVNKLVAYYQPGNRYAHVAAIGERRYYANPHTRLRSYMIDVCFGPGPFGYSARVQSYVDQDDTSQIERLYDVVSTKNYIAFVGIITNSSSLTIRKCDKSGIFSTNTHETIFQYRLPYYGVPYAVALKDDKIATASECIIINQVENATHVRLFDLPTMTMYAAQSMSSPYKSFINDLTYMPYDNTLLLVHVDQNGSYPDHRVVYFKLSATPPYNTYAITTADKRNLSSITLHNSRFFIVSDGEKIMSHYKPWVHPSNTCINIDTREIQDLDLIPYDKIQYTGHLVDGNPDHTPFFPTALSYSSDCIQR